MAISYDVYWRPDSPTLSVVDGGTKVVWLEEILWQLLTRRGGREERYSVIRSTVDASNNGVYLNFQ